MKKEMKLYMCIVALTAIGLGLSDVIFSNYFKEVYDITAFQRGLIEFPRELPGVLCIVIVSSLMFMGNIRLAIIAQLLQAIGILALAFTTPAFGIMLMFLFIDSLGMHLYFPLQDGIGMSLAEKGQVGRRMGQYKGIGIGFSMLTSMIVFLGFRSGFFRFDTQVKFVFLISGFMFITTFILYLIMNKWVNEPKKGLQKPKWIVRKEYKYYYLLAIMHGVQKQVMIVYGPWVLIEILGKQADTLSILIMASSLVGIFFIPTVGRWLDKYGVKKLLYFDALSFIGIYFIYGIVVTAFVSGTIPMVGAPVIFMYLLFILDRVSMQMDIVRVVYLRKIAISEEEVTPTLSLGISMDHIASIICAIAGGAVWGVWGPQYIFYMAALLSCINLIVAKKVEVKDEPLQTDESLQA